MKILIVDDNENSRMILKSVLGSKAHVVAEATNGQEALKMARKSPPDMIISDILMPMMDGFQLCREVRRDPALQETPFVFYTATYTDQKDEELALKLGADKFIIKPTEPDVFLKAIQDAIKDAKKGHRKSRAFREGEKDVFKLYSERLVKKLEKKMLNLEREIAERKQAEKALKNSEEKYRALFEDSKDAIYINTIEGEFIDANQSMLDLFGYTREEMIGMNATEICAHTEDRSKSLMEIEQKGVHKEYEIKFKKKDGREMDCLLTATVRRSDDGSIIGYQGLIRDITEQKRLTMEREKLQSQLRQAQKMEAIGTLSGGIAHDFNNILAAIIGFAELAKMRAPEDSEFLPNLDQILKSGIRAKTLIQQILAFSRKQELEQKPLHLKYIVKESLKLLRATLPTDIEIKEDIAKDVGVVNADPTQMQQVIMNLCTNAGHAMQEEGGVLEVNLQNVDFRLGIADLKDEESRSTIGLDPGPYLRLTVRDTGYGMTSDVKDRIFEPYFTTKKKGVGTGLGLSVVKGIVDSHGGTITVYSEPGKGSTFHVYLPLIEAEVKELEMDEQATILTGNERILFIDDEPTIVEIGKQMLERLGYEVTTRTSSIEALELFRTKRDQFDLVITDMTTPNMTGDKLAKELMKIRPDIPIIICTGFSERISEEKAKGMGIKAFGVKPLVMQDLAKTVRKALEGEKEGPVEGLILVIDDDDQIRGMLRETLEYAGYEVMDAPNGKEGIRLFRENPADLVITDLIMPEKEGIETIKELRQEYPEVKIIAISGGGRIGPEGYLKVAKGLGAQRTLTKPLERDELLKAIKELL